MKHLNNFVLIFLISVFFIFEQCKASDYYSVDSDFTVYIGATDSTNVYSLPPLRFVPNVTRVTSNLLNVTVGNANYEFKQSVSVQSGNIFNNYIVYSTKISGGNNAGQVLSYRQIFTYFSSDSDLFQLNFGISERRAGSGSIELQAYNGEWVSIETLEFSGNYNSGSILPNSNIQGWRYIVNYTLNNPWTLLRYDDVYTDGYILNEFTFTVKNSQEQQQNSLDELNNKVEQSNNLLTNIFNAISNIVDNILDGLYNLFVPTNFYNDLQSGIEDILDSLGILGYPLTFINDTFDIIKNTSTEDLTVDIPAIYYKNEIIFPHYHKDNIFYFKNIPVFSNVEKTDWLANFFRYIELDVNTLTIGDLVKTIMLFTIFVGMIRFIISIYNSMFGTDLGGGDNNDS